MWLPNGYSGIVPDSPVHDRNDRNDGDSDEEEFVYPAAEEEAPTAEQPPAETSSMEPAVELSNVLDRTPSVNEAIHTPETTQASGAAIHMQPAPSPAQLEASFAASSSGDLRQLQSVFRNARETSQVEPFALANDASSRTGLTALHIAASRGYLTVVKWCRYSYIGHAMCLTMAL
jgi:hypothetical protein